MMPAGCGLTVLRCTGAGRAAKTWRWDVARAQWSKISYSAGAWFQASEHAVADLHALAELLQQVQRDDRAFVVRGALAPDVATQVAADPAHLIRRRKHLKQNIQPTLVECDRRWLMIDIDGWPLPEWADLGDDPDGAIDHAIHELLPAEFHDAECWWQLSASAGFVAGILKAHLFFWLTEPASNDHIKKVLQQHAPAVDRAPFSAAQPHFIAAPIIVNGHDPLPRRTGWRKGLEPAVTLPALRAEPIKPRTVTGRGGTVAGALAGLGHGEGGEGFHAPLRRATLMYARQCNRFGDRDDEAFKAELREAILAAPVRPGESVHTGPYLQDHYLGSLIDGAFALLAGDAEIRTMAPEQKAATATKEHARAELKRAVEGVVDRALAWHALDDLTRADTLPEHAGIVITVGVGKSRTSREALPRFIAQAKARNLPHRVLWLVPTHRLGNEALTAIEQLGLRVAVWRGREAEQPGTGDPETGEPPQKMCLNLPHAQDAMRAGYDVESAACGSGKPGSVSCPYRAECAYQAQKAIVATADVVVASHQALFHQLPKEFSKNIGLVVVDESWWQAGLRPNQEIALASFAEEPAIHPVLRVLDGNRVRPTYAVAELDTNDLVALSAKARDALATVADGGFLNRAAVVAAGLTAEECGLAVQLEWRRKRDGLIWPGMRPAAREAALQEAAGNMSIRRRVAVWHAIRELLDGDQAETGRLQLATRTDRNGGPYRAILHHGRADVQSKIAALPLLLLDATMPADVVRHFLPRLEIKAEISAAAPHMTVTQILGGWGKSSIVPHERADDAENKRREGLLRELRDFVQAKSGGDALAVTYQAIEDRFQGVPGVRSAHFNAISGLDTFGGVRSLFVIGRPMPNPTDTRLMALALSGRPIPAEDAALETRGAFMADGSGRPINVRVYADPSLEAIRAAVTDAEVVQVIGRGRAVNRPAATPLAVFVLADVLLPLPVNNLVRWEDVRLNPVERMAARGVVFTSPADAWRACPDLFPSAEAARKAMQRSVDAEADLADNPLWIS
ncbi:MAG TPA: hypothetical protein VHO91_00975, partial [Rhodopila sp.]|nr:hypothetical protein [Rhodopila sp.]